VVITFTLLHNNCAVDMRLAKVAHITLSCA